MSGVVGRGALKRVGSSSREAGGALPDAAVLARVLLPQTPPHATHGHSLAAQEPVVAFSLLVGAVAVLMPITVVPLRQSMGFDTSQYYGAGISTQSE